ncbi:aspartic proteinase CDR1-like [Hordeum vulgare subsp. vulgare]|uniref:Peptidase A1 domain-containing protein n=1 Tax=Hordeum vulgare subsp. vulgare TaxID=112509 RepID=A0A8I6X5W3_HORVV|nr:aspartic proteinase CDR1-like [Hordeum vulgare subsp. vulgare]
MTQCRREWLLASCIISVLLFAPIVCEALSVGASDVSPPALTPHFIKQADERGIPHVLGVVLPVVFLACVLASMTLVLLITKFASESENGFNDLQFSGSLDDQARLVHSLSITLSFVEIVRSIGMLTYNTGYLKVLLLFILAPTMASSTGCPSPTFDGALEFPLFHRDHSCVQQHLGNTRSSGNIVEMDLPLPIDLIQNGDINNFLFLMPIKLGTPPVWNLVAVDTGATLSFVQCEPCTLRCHKQTDAGEIFDPSKSESFSRVGCSENKCRTVQRALHLQSKACMEKEDSCLYSMTFGGTSSYSVGKLVRDRLAIGKYAKGYSFPDFLFGCSLDTEYHQYEAGLVGFADEPFSFFEQVAPLVNYKAFSYCFPSDRRKTGYLSIGDYTRVNSTYTPLFLARQQSRYALKLDEVLVNGMALVTTPSEMIVDSGSRWTILLSDTFTQLDAAITEAMRPLGYNRNYYRGSDYICFEDAHFQQFSDWAALPVVELKFDMGVKMALQPQSSFHFNNDYGLCTYFMRDASLGSGVQLLGNTMTRSVGITFDIQGGQFGFRKGDC